MAELRTEPGQLRDNKTADLSPASAISMPPQHRAEMATSHHAVDATPTAPCTDGRCHFHRLRCDHVVKTELSEPPTPCATNCATHPLSSDVSPGPAPFECPVCVARALAKVWKTDVIDLRRQLLKMPIDAFTDLVRKYNIAHFARRRRLKMEAWLGPESCRRSCRQLATRDCALVVWKPGERKAPYPIGEFRRVYEKMEVHIDLWLKEYVDSNVLDHINAEVSRNHVCRSIEKPGVHFPREWQMEETEGEG